MQDKEIYSYVNTKANLESLLKARQRGIDSDEGKNWCYRDGAGGFHVTANQGESATFSEVSADNLVEGQLVIADASGKLSSSDVSISDLSGAKEVLHSQSSASAYWQITHNLGKEPEITTLDSSGNVIYGRVVHESTNIAGIHFGSPITGKAWARV